MNKKIIEFFVKRSIKKYAGTLNRDIPYDVQYKISAHCPYSQERDEVVRCNLIKNNYGCNPTALCALLLKK